MTHSTEATATRMKEAAREFMFNNWPSWDTEFVTVQTVLEEMLAVLLGSASIGEAFQCAAAKQGTAGGNDPASCGYPDCGCEATALPTPHPCGFYHPPVSFYSSEVVAFEKAHPFISHEKARNADGSLTTWGRISYRHSHVDACFDGWVCGRYSLTPAASAAPRTLLTEGEGA